MAEVDSFFRNPLGLALAGGGAHGAWEAGFLHGLTRAGLRFDKVMGFSSGALAAAGYCLGRADELLDGWRNVDKLRVLRLSPKLRPPSLFSGDPVWEAVGFGGDEARAKAALRCEMTAVSLCVEDRLPHYARFTPGGLGGWDGPLAAKVVASCSIPLIFPPVRIGTNGAARTYVDGGVPGRRRLRFDALAGCRDVIAAQMTRPEEMGLPRLLPWARHDQIAREIVLEQMTSGIESLKALPEPPRVYRAYPARTLEYSMLGFKTRWCAPAVDQGIADAEDFLREPGRFLA